MRVFFALLLGLIFFMPAESVAQRKVTPVENEDNKPKQPILHYYDKHGKPLVEPVLFLIDTDTVASPAARAVYPLITKLDIGFNIFDGIMMLTGQRYGSFDVNFTLPLWNWLCPAAEIGYGRAHSRPDGSNFEYNSNFGVYAKIGADYNFLYKSNPDNRAFIGLRCGFSAFNYNISDIIINSDYWNETVNTAIPNQKSFSIYGEALAGLTVKIYRNFSMGWTMRYKFRIHSKKGISSNPWYIPGYGTYNSGFGATLSLIYTLPLHKKSVTPKDATPDMIIPKD